MTIGAAGRSGMGQRLPGNLRRVLAAFGFLAAAAVMAVNTGAHAGEMVTSAGSNRPLSLLAFFDGRATSRGTVTTALVKVERFTADFSGKVTGNRLRLAERFHFADGDRLQRWDLRRMANGRYAGTVTTELGDGRMAPRARVEGRSFADGLILAYDGYAPGGSETLLGFRHVMRRLAPGAVANHVTISKFGLPIATSDVVFRRNGRRSKGH